MEPGARLLDLPASLALLDGVMPPDVCLSLRISHEANAIVGGVDPRKRRPTNSVDAQFSVYFQAAAALRDGNVTWSSYRRLEDPEIERLIDCIDLKVGDDIPSAGADLVCRSGNTELAAVRIDTPSGEPGAQLPWDRVETKYSTLTDELFGDRGNEVLDWVKQLPHERPVGALAHLLRPTERLST